MRRPSAETAAGRARRKTCLRALSNAEAMARERCQTAGHSLGEVAGAWVRARPDQPCQGVLCWLSPSRSRPKPIEQVAYEEQRARAQERIRTARAVRRRRQRGGDW